MAKLFVRTVAILFSVLLAGCSTHPIPEDVVGYSVYDITNKIRCEAREVVIARLHANPDVERAILDGLAEEKNLKSAIKSENQAANAKLALLNIERGELAAQQRFVDAGVEERAVRLAAWAKAIKSTEKPLPRPPFDRRKAEELFSELADTWLPRRDASNAKIVNFNTRVSLFERDRLARAQKIATRSAAFEKRFQKELRFLRNNFAYALRFEIEEINDARVNTADIIRAVTLGTVTVGLAAGAKQQRKGTREVRVAAKFSDLLELEKQCAEGRYFVDEHGMHPLKYPMKGRIGLDEVIDQYLRLNDPVSGMTFSTEASAGKTYTSIIRFTTTMDGSIKPATALTRKSGHRFNANGVLSATRQDIHEAVIVLVPPERPAVAAIVGLSNISLKQGDSRERQ